MSQASIDVLRRIVREEAKQALLEALVGSYRRLVKKSKKR